MGTIVAIGGGEIKDLETLAIDRRVVELAGKPHPRALFIPTASGEPEDYYATFCRVYGGELGCKPDVLHLLRKRPSPPIIAQQIASADLIYVGGGNTLRMMKMWRKHGVDILLSEAYQRGVVLSGISAGAMCWFTGGHSDSRSFAGDDSAWSYVRVRGLGLVNLLYCPHVLSENRLEHFQQFMGKYPQMGIACDDNAALEIVDNRYRLITSKSGAQAFRIYRRRGSTIITEPLEPTTDYQPLSHLLEKST